MLVDVCGAPGSGSSGSSWGGRSQPAGAFWLPSDIAPSSRVSMYASASRGGGRAPFSSRKWSSGSINEPVLLLLLVSGGALGRTAYTLGRLIQSGLGADLGRRRHPRGASDESPSGSRGERNPARATDSCLAPADARLSRGRVTRGRCHSFGPLASARSSGSRKQSRNSRSETDRHPKAGAHLFPVSRGSTCRSCSPGRAESSDLRS